MKENEMNHHRKIVDALVELCRVIDRIEIIEGVDSRGQLAIGSELTADLLAARDKALAAFRPGLDTEEELQEFRAMRNEVLYGEQNG